MRLHPFSAPYQGSARLAGSWLMVLLLLAASPRTASAAIIYKNGTISQNETWTADNTYIINGSVTVPNGRDPDDPGRDGGEVRGQSATVQASDGVWGRGDARDGCEPGGVHFGSGQHGGRAADRERGAGSLATGAASASPMPTAPIRWSTPWCGTADTRTGCQRHDPAAPAASPSAT